jgi:hypothetical protein
MSSLKLKDECGNSFETSRINNPATQYNNPEDLYPQYQDCENKKIANTTLFVLKGT